MNKHIYGESMSPLYESQQVIVFNGDPYISLKGFQQFLGLKTSEMYRKLKNAPKCVYDLYFNPTVISSQNKGKKLINLRMWKEEGMRTSPQVSRRVKKVIDFRPKKAEESLLLRSKCI